MKQSKVKSHKNQLAQQFRQKCKEQLKQEPKNYLCTSLKDNSFTLDLSSFTPDDILFFQVVLNLPISKIHIFYPEVEPGSPSKKNASLQLQAKQFYETPKFKDFIRAINMALAENTVIKILRFQRIPLSTKMIKEFCQGIKRTKSLRQLGFVDCKLTQQHLQTIKASLSQNESLITLDMSMNELCDIGGMIGHILSQHSRRRSEMIWLFNLRGETPVEDISNTGLCEINLQKNQLNDRSVIELVSFLKNDNWTKCINLKSNKISIQGVRQIAIMLKNNSSLISLDLRDNQGLTKQYSRYIYKKLLLNMEKYKQQRQQVEKKKAIVSQQQRSQLHSRNQSTIREYNNSTDNQQIHSNQLKNHRGQNNFESKQESNPFLISMEGKQVVRNNLTVNEKNKHTVQNNSIGVKNCNNCKRKTFEVLKLQKKNLDLQFQLKKLRNTLLTRNIDISSILPVGQASQNSITELLSVRYNENDDELLQRMEQIMLELTRIMENIQEQQHTKQNVSNPLDNPNSFSNTIQLYPQNSHLQELSKEIEQDRLEQILEATTSLQPKYDTIQ